VSIEPGRAPNCILKDGSRSLRLAWIVAFRRRRVTMFGHDDWEAVVRPAWEVRGKTARRKCAPAEGAYRI